METGLLFASYCIPSNMKVNLAPRNSSVPTLPHFTLYDLLVFAEITSTWAGIFSNIFSTLEGSRVNNRLRLLYIKYLIRAFLGSYPPTSTFSVLKPNKNLLLLLDNSFPDISEFIIFISNNLLYIGR